MEYQEYKWRSCHCCCYQKVMIGWPYTDWISTKFHRIPLVGLYGKYISTTKVTGAPCIRLLCRISLPKGILYEPETLHSCIRLWIKRKSDSTHHSTVRWCYFYTLVCNITLPRHHRKTRFRTEKEKKWLMDLGLRVQPTATNRISVI